jgi:glycosyltransferase involved in cell wall biosynthesis
VPRPFKEALLTVVTPVYRNEATLEDLARRVSKVAGGAFGSFEHVFVNDGSPDGSREVLRRLAAADKSVRVISLVRNFGQHTALMVGMRHARGDYVLFLDADLEESPEDIPAFVAKMMEGGFEIVVGRRTNRRGSPIRNLGGRVFTAIFNALSDHKLPDNATSMRLMTRRYVDYLASFGERPFLGGFTSWIGLPIGFVEVQMRERRGSSYSIGRLIRHALTGVVSFSTKPIRLATLTGLVVCAGSLLYGAYILTRYFLSHGTVAPGFTSLATFFAFFAGAQFVFIGLLGEYIGEIFIATKNRPAFLIYDRFGFDD